MSVQFSIDELIECAQRELGKRKTVYRRLVLSEKMDGKMADRELAMMAAIVQNLQEQKQPEFSL